MAQVSGRHFFVWNVESNSCKFEQRGVVLSFTRHVSQKIDHRDAPPQNLQPRYVFQHQSLEFKTFLIEKYTDLKK